MTGSLRWPGNRSLGFGDVGVHGLTNEFQQLSRVFKFKAI